MNILTDKLPDNVLIDGKEYKIYTDFRNWIDFELVMTDPNMDFEEKMVHILTRCYKEIPENIEDAIFALVNFYLGNTEISTDNAQNTVPKTHNSKRVLYNFDFDSEYIYAAFYEQYNIDLVSAKLHWWQFKALFKGLGNCSKFSKIINYRAMDISGIKDASQKKFYKKMKKLYALPDFRSEDEKNNDFCEGIIDAF